MIWLAIALGLAIGVIATLVFALKVTVGYGITMTRRYEHALGVLGHIHPMLAREVGEWNGRGEAPMPNIVRREIRDGEVVEPEIMH